MYGKCCGKFTQIEIWYCSIFVLLTKVELKYVQLIDLKLHKHQKFLLNRNKESLLLVIKNAFSLAIFIC